MRRNKWCRTGLAGGLAGLWLMSAVVRADDKAVIAQANKYVERGNKFTEEESYARAKSEYLKALRVFPKHVDAMYNLAVVCERLGQIEEALAAYQKYLDIRPQDADVWPQVGGLYDRKGQRKTRGRPTRK